jgi:hypothetical protein
MLQIKPIITYTVAKYPEGSPYVGPPRETGGVIRDAALLATIATLMQSCFPIMGVPLPPKILSENEARAKIVNLFAKRGVALTEDSMLQIKTDGDSIRLVLDGYNDSLRVGYEYIQGTDMETFTPEACAEIDSLQATGAQHILLIKDRESATRYEQVTDMIVERFLNTLKAQGII